MTDYNSQYVNDPTIPTGSLFIPDRRILWEVNKPLIMAFCLSHRINMTMGSLPYSIPLSALWDKTEFLECISSVEGEILIAEEIFNRGTMEGNLTGDPSLPLLDTPPMISVEGFGDFRDSQVNNLIQKGSTMNCIVDSFMRLVRFLLANGATLEKVAPDSVQEAYKAFCRGERTDVGDAKTSLVKIH